MILNRRTFLVGTAALAAGASVSVPFFLPKYHSVRRAKRSRVAILHVEQYSQRIDQILASGLRLFRINVQGKTVVLKPNLVDYIPGNAINTHPTLVLAAAESFRRMGAKCVIVAEGPGHQRDTELVLSQSGYRESLRDEALRFVDLNRDELVRTQLRASYMGMKSLWLPRTVLKADFLVSMPKIKAHHWAGVTLSMKNMLGVVPGSRYGWPKNILHWKAFRKAFLTCPRPSRSTSLSPTALWQWKGTAHLTAPLVLWERSCLRTIRLLLTPSVRGSWGSSPTESSTSARAQSSWATFLLRSSISWEKPSRLLQPPSR